MQDAKLMLDAGRGGVPAARAKDMNALEALNDQLYTSSQAAISTIGRITAAARRRTRPPRPHLPRRRPPAHRLHRLRRLHVPPLRLSRPVDRGPLEAPVAEDLRADGSVARYPWGQHPVGAIVVERGACYLQIMSSDTPSFSAGTTAPGRADEDELLSSYIAYSGPCVITRPLEA